ncbi:MAG: dihydroorotate dehydrogenase [Anaerolineae bacterium]|nr:dihydroorotate dehydrogenase [Anaerolineae bacterium]
MIPLRNPLVLASGPLGRDARSMMRFAGVAGALVTKSVTRLRQEGNPPPRVARVGEWAFVNWEDLPNPGCEAMAAAIRGVKASGTACPIIGSIGPLKSPEEQRDIARILEEAGADALELNFKWAAGFADNLLARVVRAVKGAVSIPVIVKLAPFVGDIVENARAAEDAGADALTAINSVFPAMQIDVRRQRPTLSTGFGGLSGRPILPLAVAAIYRLYETVRIPILGSGGVVTGEDALQMLMAGAQAVQICTAPMVEGPAAFPRIQQELEALVQELGLGSPEACVGLAHRQPIYRPKSATVRQTL